MKARVDLRFSRILQVSIAVTVLSGCVQTQGLLPAVSNSQDSGGFTFEISQKYETLSSQGSETFDFTIDDQSFSVIQDQLIVKVSNPKKIEEIMTDKTLGVSTVRSLDVPDDFALKSAPHGRDMLETKPVSKRNSNKELYLISLPTTEQDDISDLQKGAEGVGVKGRFHFKSKRSASLFNKLVKLKEKHSEGLSGFSFNYPCIESGITTEGYDSTPGYPGLWQAPNNYGFWWVGDNHPLYGFYGANVIGYDDEFWNYPSNFYPTIAVIDRGFQSADEPSINQAVVKYWYWEYDFENGDDSFRGAQGVPGKEFHGRSVASVIFAPRNDSKGTLGLAPESQPMLLHTGADLASRIQAIYAAVDSGANVINMSWSVNTKPSQWRWWPPGYYDPLHEAIKYAYDNNVITVSGSGNDGDGVNGPNYPAYYSETIGVGAHDHYIETTWSNTPSADILAPGSNVAAAASPLYFTAEYFTPTSGTSIASPLVAAVAAISFSRGQVTSATALNRLIGRAYYSSATNYKSCLNAINTVKP